MFSDLSPRLDMIILRFTALHPGTSLAPHSLFEALFCEMETFNREYTECSVANDKKVNSSSVWASGVDPS